MPITQGGVVWKSRFLIIEYLDLKKNIYTWENQNIILSGSAFTWFQ